MSGRGASRSGGRSTRSSAGDAGWRRDAARGAGRAARPSSSPSAASEGVWFCVCFSLSEAAPASLSLDDSDHARFPNLTIEFFVAHRTWILIASLFACMPGAHTGGAGGVGASRGGAGGGFSHRGGARGRERGCSGASRSCRGAPRSPSRREAQGAKSLGEALTVH